MVETTTGTYNEVAEKERPKEIIKQLDMLDKLTSGIWTETEALQADLELVLSPGADSEVDIREKQPKEVKSIIAERLESNNERIEDALTRIKILRGYLEI